MPCHNKPAGFALDGVDSCLVQDMPLWELFIMENSDNQTTREDLRSYLDDTRFKGRVHYCELNLDDVRRSTVDVPVWLCNRFYPMANGDFILYMSDDDLWLPGIFARITEVMDRHPDWDGLYFNSTLSYAYEPGQGLTGAPWIGASYPRGCGQLDSQIDGGQMTFRKSVLDRVRPPWFPEDRDPSTMSHSDGILMERLAREGGVTFNPVPFDGLVHRRTPFSVYTKAG